MCGIEFVLCGGGVAVEQGGADLLAADERGGVGLVVERLLAGADLLRGCRWFKGHDWCGLPFTVYGSFVVMCVVRVIRVAA